MREWFENGWGFLGAFLLCALALVSWQATRGPWREATALLPDSTVALRLAVRPPMLPGLPSPRRLQAVRAGGPPVLLAQGEELSAPVAVFHFANRQGSWIRLRGPALDRRVDLEHLEPGGPARPGDERLVGFFRLAPSGPVFDSMAGQPAAALALVFRKKGLPVPRWAEQALPRPTPRPSPTAEPTPRAAAAALGQWRRDAAFLEGLLRQHAPGLFSQYRVPTLEDRRGNWRSRVREDGSPRFLAGGDFNGDRRKDYVFILPRQDDSGFGVLGLVSTPQDDYRIHRLSQGEGRPQRFTLDSQPPGIYPVTEIPEGSLADPDGEGIVLETDSLRFSQRGVWTSILFWQASQGTFRDLAAAE